MSSEKPKRSPAQASQVQVTIELKKKSPFQKTQKEKGQKGFESPFFSFISFDFSTTKQRVNENKAIIG